MPCRKYIYIHATLQQKIYSYTYFPPNLVQKACLQALASSCKHYHSKSRIQGFRFKIQKEPFESRREDSRFKIFSVFPWIQGLDTRFKIQNSRSKKNFLNPAGGFKIQDFHGLFLNPGAWAQDSRSKKNFLNPGGRIQDSRFSVALLESRGLDTRLKIQDPKRISGIEGGGFKIQYFQMLFLNPGAWIQDWRFKIQKRTSWIQGGGFKIQDFQGLFLNPGAWIQDSRCKKNVCFHRGVYRVWIQEVLFGSWILNLESCIQAPGFKKSHWKSWILNPPPWILEVLFESWILNLVPKPLDSRKATEILNLQSCMQAPGFKESHWKSWILNPAAWIQEVLFGSWILNLESGTWSDNACKRLQACLLH